MTRRTGWKFLKAGDILQPIVKGQGIPKGGKVEKIGGPIRVVSVRIEKLARIFEFDYGDQDLLREGMHCSLTPFQFVLKYFPRADVEDLVTRIEFEYV